MTHPYLEVYEEGKTPESSALDKYDYFEIADKSGYLHRSYESSIICRSVNTLGYSREKAEEVFLNGSFPENKGIHSYSLKTIDKDWKIVEKHSGEERRAELKRVIQEFYDGDWDMTLLKDWAKVDAGKTVPLYKVVDGQNVTEQILLDYEPDDPDAYLKHPYYDVLQTLKEDIQQVLTKDIRSINRAFMSIGTINYIRFCKDPKNYYPTPYFSFLEPLIRGLPQKEVIEQRRIEMIERGMILPGDSDYYRWEGDKKIYPKDDGYRVRNGKMYKSAVDEDRENLTLSQEALWDRFLGG